MIWRILQLLGPTVAIPVLAAAGHAAAAPIDAAWARLAIWDDGLAEIAGYDATRTIYGAERPYRAVLLTVKEEFDTARLVKADPPWGGRPLATVLKQNAVREIPTPNYEYRIMTSSFVRRDDPSLLLKLTSTSHEWCGNTWKAIRSRGGRTEYEWSSYFDGELDGEQRLDLRPGDLFEDQLPLTLRGLRFADRPEFRTRLFPTMATSHGGPIEAEPVTVRVAERETLEVAAGRFETWRVEVVSSGRTIRLWFDHEGSHPLIKLDGGDGNTLSLSTIERRAYWKLP